MIPLLALLSRLWRSPVGRGVALALGGLAAVWGYGAARYHAGHRDGRSQEQVASAQRLVIETSIVDSVARALSTAQRALRDQTARLKDSAAVQAARLAAATARAADAETVYVAARAIDTAHTPALQACDLLVRACATARLAAAQAAIAAAAVMASQQAQLTNRDSVILTEPDRLRLGIERALVAEQAAHPARTHRVLWMVVGAVLAEGARAVVRHP